METFKILLEEISSVLEKERTFREEQKEKGLLFNVFDVLKLSRSETRLHSAFIAELLNPKGLHGMQDAFLKAFINRLLPGFDFETSNADVLSEFYIGPISKDCTHGGRIDLLLKDKNNRGVIIENKIDADDQSNQLLRYYNFGKEKLKDFRIVYLTSNGGDASDKSIGGHEFDYLRVSYKSDIVEWLDDVIGLSSNHSPVKEIVVQYRLNIKQIFGLMNTENERCLLDIACNKSNIEATLSIIEHSWDIGQTIRKKFVADIKVVAENRGFLFSCDEHLCDLWQNQWITMSRPDISPVWSIYIGWDEHTNRGGACYGVSRVVGNFKSGIYKKDLGMFPHIWNEQEQTKEFPFGWAYFRGDTGKWWRWDDVSTLRDMANGRMLQFIEGEIINKTIDNQLLEKIHDFSGS